MRTSASVSTVAALRTRLMESIRLRMICEAVGSGGRDRVRIEARDELGDEVAELLQAAIIKTLGDL